MIKKLNLKKLLLLITIIIGAIGITQHASASAFQLWEQDAISVGNYHSGRVALANDASVAFYNPAGMVRIKNQEVVLAGIAVLTDIKYRGIVAVNTFHANAPQTVTSQGGGFNFIPNLHYVSPLNDTWDFGFSIAVPFASQVSYGRPTVLRYASTLAQTQVVDISPSLGYKLNEKLSLGVGLDIQKMSAQFDQVGVLGTNSDTNSTNKGFDTAYGCHFGLLYQFNSNTRAGLSYNSQVVHHLRGSSQFVGPIATLYNGAPIVTTAAHVNLTLPPYTTLSLFRNINPQWSVMGTLSYTQWTTIRNIVMQGLAGIAPGGIGKASTNLVVIIPQYYRNTWNISAGADYAVNDKFTFRSGLGYDQTPTNNSYRNVQMPDSNRYAVAFGGHYQATKTVSFDLGWTHLFLQGSGETGNINPPVQQTGAEKVTTRGSVDSSADVFGAQVTWDML